MTFNVELCEVITSTEQEILQWPCDKLLYRFCIARITILALMKNL